MSDPRYSATYGNPYLRSPPKVAPSFPTPSLLPLPDQPLLHLLPLRPPGLGPLPGQHCQLQPLLQQVVSTNFCTFSQAPPQPSSTPYQWWEYLGDRAPLPPAPPPPPGLRGPLCRSVPALQRGAGPGAQSLAGRTPDQCAGPPNVWLAQQWWGAG